MAEFIAKDPNTEVIGFFVQSYIIALGKEIGPVAANFGFDHIDPQGWYRQQTLLDLLKEASQGDMNAVFDMVKVGMRITEMGLRQLEIPAAIEAYFAALPESARQTHRNGKTDPAMEYRSTLLRPGHIEFYVASPYPCDASYGARYAAARLTRPPDHDFTVTHRHGSCRKMGDDYCIYDIKWEEEDDGVAGFDPALSIATSRRYTTPALPVIETL